MLPAVQRVFDHPHRRVRDRLVKGARIRKTPLSRVCKQRGPVDDEETILFARKIEFRGISRCFPAPRRSLQTDRRLSLVTDALRRMAEQGGDRVKNCRALRRTLAAPA